MNEILKRTWYEQVRLASTIRGWDEKTENQLVHRIYRLLEQNLPVILDFAHLSRQLSLKKRELAALVYRTDRFYKHFFIRKRSGGWRDIAAPTVLLKASQRWILQKILCAIRPTDCAHGFVPERSIVTNARNHVGKNVVLNLDIKDFFPSIGWSRVYGMFRHLGYDKKVSYYLSRLTTLDERLPQGAPTSPMISNHIVAHLDRRLYSLAEENDFTYTRYADDLTFSGESELLTSLPLIRKILKEEGFLINETKTRIMLEHRQQEVTGLVVNKRVAVKRAHRRWLRQQAFYLKKHGLEDCKARKPQTKRNTREFFYGHALYLKMVDPVRGEALLKDLDVVAW